MTQYTPANFALINAAEAAHARGEVSKAYSQQQETQPVLSRKERRRQEALQRKGKSDENR